MCETNPIRRTRPEGQVLCEKRVMSNRTSKGARRNKANSRQGRAGRDRENGGVLVVQTNPISGGQAQVGRFLRRPSAFRPLASPWAGRTYWRGSTVWV